MSFFYGPDGFDMANTQGWDTSKRLEAAYKRDSTLDWKAKQTKRIADAYAKPNEFFDEKSKAIAAAADKAANVYREEFIALTNQLVPASLAHTRALKMANGYEELLRADLEEQFPSDLSNLSLQLVHDNGQAAKSGFATPSTHLSAKPEAAPRHRKSSRK